MLEEDLRLCKNYKITQHSDKKLISNDKLSDFLKEHFTVKNIELQPEVTSPKNYPYILSSDDLHINDQAPEVAEVQDVLKHLKNGKCFGTDLLHTEHLKYNSSNRFMVFLMLLLTTIWPTFTIP